MTTFIKSSVPAATSFVLRWSDNAGQITVAAHADEKDKDGKLIGEVLGTMVFDTKEASAQNTLQAAVYGFKKKIQDDGAQIVPGAGFTLQDKFESFASTWDTMKSESWTSKRSGGGSQKIDLYRIAGAIALGNDQPLDKAFAIQNKLASKSKEEIKAILASAAVIKGLPLFDKMMAEQDEIELG